MLFPEPGEPKFAGLFLHNRNCVICVSTGIVKARDAIEQCIANGDARMIAHMAWIAGEMMLGARNPEMRIWADDLITRGQASDNPDTQKDFTFTRQRVAGLFRTGAG